MPDILRTGTAWLTGQLQAHASEPVTYTRGAETIDVRATFGRKLFQLDDGQGGIRMEWTDKDFLIPVASLALGGNFVVPRRGDEVRVDTGLGVEVYAVLAPGGEAPWTYADPFEQIYRIHGKRVATEGAYYA